MKRIISYFNCMSVLYVMMLFVGSALISCSKDEVNGESTITNTSSGVDLTLSLKNLTEVSVTFYGKAVLADSYSADAFGIFYSTDEEITASSATNLPIVDICGTDYSLSISSLNPETTYYYTYYIKQGTLYKYGEVKSFTTKAMVAPILDAPTEITGASALVSGSVVFPSDTSSNLEFGFQYSTSEDFSSNVTTQKIIEVDSENKFSFAISSLAHSTRYYCRSYIKMNGIYKYGEVKEFETIGITLSTPSDATNLSASSTANCYIVSQSGKYCFKIYKGNSSDFIGRGEDVPQGFPSSAAVLWETFGTSTAPSVGDLIKNVTYKDGYITFEASDKKGNAVIAAKDASGTILWSWHIWMTDEPQGQVYYNSAGTMMDRNLGATSATSGDVGALGLLYQWGRKDPFLGSSSISSNTIANSTITWPDAVASSSTSGTVAYVTANPTTYVYGSSSLDYDWHYSSRDSTLWSSAKSIYDPCPAGWRVPDGGSSGVWSKAAGSSSRFNYTYNSTNEGMNFSGKFGSASTIWYPASGYRSSISGGLNDVGSSGRYWSASSLSYYAYLLYFNFNDNVSPSSGNDRAEGKAVRCLQVIDEAAEP